MFWAGLRAASGMERMGSASPVASGPPPSLHLLLTSCVASGSEIARPLCALVGMCACIHVLLLMFSPTTLQNHCPWEPGVALPPEFPPASLTALFHAASLAVLGTLRTLFSSIQLLVLLNWLGLGLGLCRRSFMTLVLTYPALGCRLGISNVRLPPQH